MRRRADGASGWDERMTALLASGGDADPERGGECEAKGRGSAG